MLGRGELFVAAMMAALMLGGDAAFAASLTNEPVDSLCRFALNRRQVDDWEPSERWADYVAEAKRRNLSIDDCRAAIDLPRLSMAPADEPVTELCRFALKRRKLDSWETSLKWADYVAEVKRRDLSIDDCRTAIGLPKL